MKAKILERIAYFLIKRKDKYSRKADLGMSKTINKAMFN